MEDERIEIYQVNSDTFEKEQYKSSDTSLMLKSNLDTSFDKDLDYIEFYVYDENKSLIYPDSVIPLNNYNVKQGDVLINPSNDLKSFGFDIGKYYISYNFYRRRLGSDPATKYYIKEISSDRTEIRLASNSIPNEVISTGAETFTSYRNLSNYFIDFYLNFGANNIAIANNLVVDVSNAGDATLLIKLYDPLPINFNVKSQCWIVEKLSNSQTYEVNFPFIPTIEDSKIYLSGPNFNLNIKDESAQAGQLYSYNTLLNSDITSSTSQLNNLLNSKQININVNYEDFGEFVNFSSAKTRLENFYYKVGLIESASNQLSQNIGNIAGSTTLTAEYSSSKAELTSIIDNTINNFDGYEYFLYFNSGSDYSYPKSNTAPPYTLLSTSSIEVLNWIGSADPTSTYYGGLALSASNYDQQNQDWLYWAIPEYLRNDPENARYELFLDMIGQHYDNIWLYTKDISNKYNADNRIDFGVSRDLVAQAIRDFGVKIYSNNFNTDDLYTAFLGLTPSGSLFPFPNITGSIGGNVDTPSGYEYVDTKISSSNDVISLDSTNKRLYKRIYHNIPYLLKTKGTAAGLRALITSYGIPDTMLRVNEFGGKDKNNNQDWDLEQNVFNYAFNTGADSDAFLTSSLVVNNFIGGAGDESPHSIQFRFKTAGLPTPTNNLPSSDIRYSQSLFSTDDGGNIVLEYTGSGLVTGSYSGSVVDPYDYYGTLKWIPANSDNPNLSASIYLPFFDGNWWSLQMSSDGLGGNSTLYAANQIDGKIGFSGSDEANGYDGAYYNDATKAFLNKNSNVNLNGVKYKPFSGSFQELRYWSGSLNEDVFFDYVVNPYSTEGNTINSTPDSLIFRAALGTQLDTGSRTSIHPRVTGSASQITQSFDDGTSGFHIVDPNDDIWVTNTEKIYQDQVIAGIKNRITDRVTVQTPIFPAPPSGSNADTTVLSPLESILQPSIHSESYSPGVDYLEVAFSPQDQINDDINAQIGYFNIGDYIGDPREFLSSSRSYPDLDELRDGYFEKYYKNYDVKDFVRLIKFFDNSLFKMIKDFTPARTSLASGVVVKQHILERNRQRQALASSSLHDYTGSIKPQSRNYNTGSNDIGQYEYTSGSAIYRFSGGTGGSFERYNGLNTSVSASKLGLSNKFFLTQSYSESIQGSVANTITNSGSFVGFRTKITSDQAEFYDGEFSGSQIQATTQSLNPGCDPYLRVVDTPISLYPLFFSLTEGVNNSTTTLDVFSRRNNYPKTGYVWIGYEYNTITERNEVVAVKFPVTDLNGNFIRDYIDDSSTIQLFLSDGNTKYYIRNIDRFANGVLALIDNTQGDFLTTSSADGGSENWSLIAQGSYNTRLTVDTESINSDQQGVFLNPLETFQNQNIFYWNGNIQDAQGYFNIGSTNKSSSAILGTDDIISGSYNIPNSSNIGWFISGSIVYSSSNTTFDGNGTALGLYHSASNYPSTAYSQVVPMGLGGIESAVLRPSPKFTSLNNAVFQSSYNDLIPGNSGSGTPITTLGGHPKFRVGATSSLDFYFPYFNLSGSVPPSSTTLYWTAFSGSTLDASNGDFDTTTTIDSSIIEISNYSASRDGAAQIHGDGLELYATINAQQPSLFPDSATLTDLQIRPKSIFTATSGLNVTSSFQYATTYGNFFNLFGKSGTFSTGSSGTWQVTPFLYVSLNTLASSEFWIRPVVKSPLSTFEYTMTEYDVDLKFTCLVQYDGGTAYYETHEIINALNTSGQNGTNNDFFPYNVSTGVAGTGDIQVHLKVTGSGGERLITSSVALTGVDMTEGATYTFTDSPILNIENDTTATDSTRTDIGDMYFVEYSMSNFVGGTGPGFVTVDADLTENSDKETKIFITSSFADANPGYDLTGSVYVTHGNTRFNNTFGNSIVQESFIVPNEAQNNVRVNFTGSFESISDANDIFRMGVNVNKNFSSGLEISEYTMSIFPSQSVNAEITGESAYDNYNEPSTVGLFVPTFFGNGVVPYNKALDCQPLLNNYSETRLNTFLMGVDYTNVTGSTYPVNLRQILNNTADKADIPDSNYTALKSINPRYDGVKSTCKEINTWNIGDYGTFGKLPNIELKDAYFGYFNDLSDDYPTINGLTRVNLNYLIDEQSNALPPSLPSIGKSTLLSVFPVNTQTSIAIQSGSSQYASLGESSDIKYMLKRYSPIMYSQNSGNNYTDKIQLSGSGYVSRYDNDDENDQVFAQFTAQGTASVDTSNPVTSVDYYIDPSEDVTGNPQNDYNPWTEGGSDSVSYPQSEWGGTVGDDLSNAQVVSLKHSILTTMVSETDRVGAELRYEFHAYSGSSVDTEVPFNLEEIEIKVHRDDGTVTDLGSALDYGWFHMENIVDWRRIRRKERFSVFNKTYNRWRYTKVPIPTGGIKLAVDGYEMMDTLFDRGITQERKPKTFVGVKAVEWVITANTGNNIIKVGDDIRFRVIGQFKNARGGWRQGYFFPEEYSGVKTPSRIQGQGVYDHLLTESNIAQAPFWVFSGSAGGGSTVISTKHLVMSSSNMNEAYGTSFSQGDLEYYPGPSEYFPGGIEPATTSFDKIEFPLQLFEGDEIRFGNNENFTYKIIRVWSPDENIEGGKSRLKIEVDREIDKSINKDFFLVRRPVDNLNTIYLDSPFPYASLASASISTGIIEYTGSRFALTGSIDTGSGGNADLSGSYSASFSSLEIATTPGILYPDYPTTYLIESASIIVNDLISKGVIQS